MIEINHIIITIGGEKHGSKNEIKENGCKKSSFL
jgi:hypothetical protein